MASGEAGLPGDAARDAGAAASLAPALELAALGAGLTLTVGALARLPSWYRELGAFQLLFAVAFLFYITAVARLDRYARLPRVGIVVFGVALACRALLVPVPPSLSGDLYRYVWEGRVWLHGGNPYVQPPAAAALAPLRDPAIFPFVNHPQLSAIYPPLAEAGFALVAALQPSVLAFKLWVALHDLALVAVLLVAARSARGSAVGALIYAWNPLVMVEAAGSGHNDPTAMLGLALAFLLRERRPVLSALALGWGALVKLAPLVALPFLWRGWPWRARLTALAVLLPGLGWFYSQTRGSESGLAAYWGSWRNNELLFALVERLCGGFRGARVATLGVTAVVAIALLLRRMRPDLAVRRTLGTALLTSPVVHPWYAGWMLMFSNLEPSRFWILFTALLPLNYGFLRTPVEGRAFHLPLGGRLIEYGLPLAVGLVWRAVDHSVERAGSDVP